MGGWHTCAAVFLRAGFQRAKTLAHVRAVWSWGVHPHPSRTLGSTPSSMHRQKNGVAMLVSLLMFLTLGAIAGVLAGLLGVGGGLVLVAALAWMLPGVGVPK